MVGKFRDFITGRNQQQKAPVAQKPQASEPAAPSETTKAKYTREALIEKANQVQRTPDQEARARKVGEVLRQATQHLEAPQPNAPASGDGKAALLQNQNRQEKTQAALSPTDNAAGKTAIQAPTPSQEKTPQRQPTTPRRPPSWER